MYTLLTQTNEDGSLKFSAGNVCMHYYSFEFLRDKCTPDKLPKVYHRANKKIPTADAAGKMIPKAEVSEITGMKLETYIFDVFPSASPMAVLEVPRCLVLRAQVLRDRVEARSSRGVHCAFTLG